MKYFLSLLVGLSLCGFVHATEFPADAITITDSLPMDGLSTTLIDNITDPITILDAQIKGTFNEDTAQYDSLAYINCNSTDLAQPINLVFGTPENYVLDPGKTHYFSGHVQGNMICGRIDPNNPPAFVALDLTNDGGIGIASFSITYVPYVLSTTTMNLTTIADDPTRNTFLIFFTLMSTVFLVLWYMNIKKL